MPKYNNENTGVLFPESKRESDSSPHATGTLEVTAPGKYRAAAWKNQSQSGPVMNIRLTRLDEDKQPEQYRRSGIPNQPTAAPSAAPAGDDPF
tara:strand:- start:76 stop:354 length:279 start_codon:yes stop_codon:yes gene_type:complete